MSDYAVPELTRGEVQSIRDRDPRPADCLPAAHVNEAGR